MAFINFGMANTLAQAKASSNKNKLFFPTDSKKIVIDGKEYGGIDGVDIESKTSMYSAVGNGNNITDGVAAIKGIKGNTVAWNQLVSQKKYTNSQTDPKSINVQGNMMNGNTFVSTIIYPYVPTAGQITRRVITAPAGVNRFVFKHSGKVGDLMFFDIHVTQGHKYYVTCLYSDIDPTTVGGFVVDNKMFIDLTLIYGAGNEPTSVEEFEADYKRWFGKLLCYEPYDEGSLRNVKMSAIKTVGFNQWDEEWENGTIESSTGQNSILPTTEYIRSKNYIPIIQGLSYFITKPSSQWGYVFYYDINKKYLGASTRQTLLANTTGSRTLNIPDGCGFVRFIVDGISYGYTYNHDICINLSWSGYRNGEYEPYWESIKNLPVTQLTGKLNGQGESVIIFPDGMNRAESVYDEIKVENGVTKAIKRVGAVDLGTLDWSARTENVFTLTKVTQRVFVENNRIICSKYTTTSATSVGNMEDKSIGAFAAYNNKDINVKDTSYSDASTFKAAMDGVMLYYELETPEEYILDDNILPAMYKVDDFGTEEVLPACTDEAPCCAPELDIRYRITPVEVLDNFSKVTNNKQVKAVADNARLLNRIVTWGGDGATVKDGGKSINDLLPVSLTIDWSTDVLIVSEYSNFKDTPNAIVCNFLGSVIPMTFCYDQSVSKLIGMFVATTNIANACQDEAGIYLNIDEMYVLQIDVEWDAGNLQDLDAISIRKMDGTYVYPGGDDSSSSGSGSGSEPYDDWQINGNTPDGTSIFDLNNFNYVGRETISMITCCPEGSDNPIFVTGSSSGEYTKDVTWDSTNNYWEVEGSLSTEGTYVLKAYNTSYNPVSEIQIIIV